MNGLVCISDSPLARAMREACEFAYHDGRTIEFSVKVRPGAGCTDISFEASAVMRFSQENSLCGVATTTEGQSLPIEMVREHVGDGGDYLFFKIG